MENTATINYKGKEIKLVFNLNVMQVIQEEYKTIDAWGKLTDGSSGEVDIKALIFGLTQMINEGIEIDNDENGTDEPLLTEKKVGRIITDVGLANATKALNQTVINSTKDDSGKNA
ncbi:hypothetical protein [Methanobrevibacter sp.]|jgi:hypothetical protein|uniref:hypothetical protein n=1 Tax=Methanobrevibacter sp. TaxID=66852 RepID=UPI003890F33A